jgi:CSLREA domain-containing protein
VLILIAGRLFVQRRINRKSDEPRWRRSFAERIAAIAVGLIFGALASPLVSADTYVVNSTLDEPNVDPSTGNCVSTPSAKCTLRAAIMVANFTPGPNTITVPAGVYLITRVGYDDDALVGDLDIKHDLTIQGAGSGVTIIDGNGSVTHDRVFQILSTVQNLTLSGMTIRNGESLSRPTPTPTPAPTLGGGGLYIEGAGQVHLSDVIVDSNTGINGGGIYANFSSMGGSIEMDHVIVRANRAIAGGVGEGAGVFAVLSSGLSQVIIRDSQVYSNTADGTGGGLFVEGNTTAHWSILRSEIYSNTAASGGGIGNFVPLVLSDSRLHDNHATFDGGAIEAYAPFAISRTTLNANSANRFGGAIFGLQVGPYPSYTYFASIAESTLSGNFAQYGGGIYHDGFITPNSLLTLVNSTVNGNSVALGSATPAPSPSPSAAGGGIYIYGGQTQLFNTTVASNRVQLRFPSTYSGIGGGLYITAGATFTAQNSMIANNTRGNGITLEVPDDGFTDGTVTGMLAYNLITNTQNFFITGPQGGNIVGQDPLLGPLQDNGGPTQTRALLPGSPAVDAAAPAGCTDDLGSPLRIDQRGFPRPYPAGGPCDMGAFEFQPVLSIDDVTVTQGNSGTTSAVFTVGLSPASTQTVAVDYATADGTATTADGDYQPASGTLTFNPGDPPKTITVLVNGDPVFEPTETFFVNLGTAVNAAIAKGQGTGTIVNSNPAPTPTPTPTPAPTPTTLGNISTRLRVETGDNVLIGGFIVTGTQPKRVIVRAIGPSLSSFFPGALADPVLELRNSSGGLIASNDNWRSTQEAEIIATGIPPSNDLESAIVATLPANNSAYTAIVRGVNNGTGIGVVEAYDLDRTVDSKLANISTRGFVQTGDNVLIGGLIVVGRDPLRVIVRAIGPSLPLPGALGDPTLELRDINGALIAANDNWRSDQEAEIIATTIPPTNDLESAIVRNLVPGNYTAIVRGVNGTTGIALVEAYGLN